jgi:hypothetical protein
LVEVTVTSGVVQELPVVGGSTVARPRLVSSNGRRVSIITATSLVRVFVAPPHRAGLRAVVDALGWKVIMPGATPGAEKKSPSW